MVMGGNPYAPATASLAYLVRVEGHRAEVVEQLVRVLRDEAVHDVRHLAREVAHLGGTANECVRFLLFLARERRGGRAFETPNPRV